jgi:flavorubredoxin
MADNQVIKLKDDLHWVGIRDYDIVTFDVVMETKYGTTYNSYFIDADKKVIVETSKEKFWDEYITKIRQVVDPAEIDYIVLNHTEPDHSGNLINLLNLAPNATVIGSGNAIRYLKDLTTTEFPHKVVKDGYTLDLGNKTLQFISAPNLHWPDSMYTYLVEDKVLFTCDSFGCHYASEEIIDSEAGDFDDAFKYYFDVILKPFSKFMLKAIDKISGLEIVMICPGHGPVLRDHWEKYVKWSQDLSEEYMKQPDKLKVFIPYVSAYQKTGAVAEVIGEGIRSIGDFDVDICDIENCPIGELDQKVSQSAGIIVGSPTINQNILLPIYKLFSVISPLRDKGKLAGGFGSYGWSGEGRTLINSQLENLKLDVMGEGVFVKFTPDEKEKDIAFEFGKEFGETLLKKANT